MHCGMFAGVCRPQKYSHTVFEILNRAKTSKPTRASPTLNADVELFVAMVVRATCKRVDNAAVLILAVMVSCRMKVRARVMLLPRSRRHPHVSVGEVQVEVSVCACVDSCID